MQPNSSSVSPARNASQDVQEWRGGFCNGVGVTGGINAFAVLKATSDAIEFNTSIGNYRLPRAAVVRMRRGQLYPWFFRGFRIYHQQPGIPDNLQFCPTTGQSSQVIARLGAMGYPVG